jgi:acetate kinase
MAMASGHPGLLTINVGSSSLKSVLFRMGAGEHIDVRATAAHLGTGTAELRVVDAHATDLHRARVGADHGDALDAWFEWLRDSGRGDDLFAVGHRVVHGGDRYDAPVLVDDHVVTELQRLEPLDPEHMPQALRAIELTRRAFPSVPQVACFDTAFHRTMPRVATLLPLPRRFRESGLRRYGFHGLSYEYVMYELRRIDPHAANGRVVIAHLGSGASMAAVRHGVGVDTTMGLTAAGGLVMSTRSGDLDPGVLAHLLTSGQVDVDSLSALINEESGLLGVSGSSADMEALLARENADAGAADAVALFCYQARKHLGALIAVLGGLDTLVFTAGIGEHSATVRERICNAFDHVGLELDPASNERHAPVVSSATSRVVVRVLATDEALMIARHTSRVVADGGNERVRV